MATFFPNGTIQGSEEKNNSFMPSAYLYGRRFFDSQIAIELLSEMLLVMIAEKKTVTMMNGSSSYHDEFEYFPSKIKNMDDVRNIEYSVNYRVNFKLLSLYSTGKKGKFVPGHKEKFNELRDELRNVLEVDDDSAEYYISALINLYQGFQIAGAERDWCARSFLPITKELLTGETIWQDKGARDNHAIDDFDSTKQYYAHHAHNFYARGGELLYLQLVAAFTKNSSDVKAMLEQSEWYNGLKVSEDELEPQFLKERICRGLDRLLGDDNGVPSVFKELITRLDPVDKTQPSDNYNYSQKSNVGRIPQSTWVEGYIFALELSRLFQSSFDNIEMLRLLELECSLQKLRTMINTSARYLCTVRPDIGFVAADCKNSGYKQTSHHSYGNAIQLIKNAQIEKAKELGLALDPNAMKDAHSHYGYKMFIKTGKEIGLIVPKKGGNEHFIGTKNLVTLMVATTLCPCDSLTFDSFLEDIHRRFGFVFDDTGFSDINRSNGKKKQEYDEEMCDWLIGMLSEGGYYISLSDALSLVKNTNSEV